MLVAALLCAAGLGRAADAQAAELFYGVDTQNRLVTFSGQTPASIARTTLTGLQTGERIIFGLDVRPANKQLLALGSTSRLYRIDPATGAATVIGTTPFRAAARRSVVRLRLQSHRRPDPAHVGCATGPSPPSGHRRNGRRRRDAHLCGRRRGSGCDAADRRLRLHKQRGRSHHRRQLFNLDAGRDALVHQNPPNNGTLISVGSLGVDVATTPASTSPASTVSPMPRFRRRVGRHAQLYTINLTTGAATAVGRIGGKVALRALAAAGAPPRPTPPHPPPA